MTSKEMEMYNLMVEWNIATAKELNLAKNLVGPWTQALEAVLYIRTGYNTWDQYLECEFEEEV